MYQLLKQWQNKIKSSSSTTTTTTKVLNLRGQSTGSRPRVHSPSKREGISGKWIKV